MFPCPGEVVCLLHDRGELPESQGLQITCLWAGWLRRSRGLGISKKSSSECIGSTQECMGCIEAVLRKHVVDAAERLGCLPALQCDPSPTVQRESEREKPLVVGRARGRRCG